MKTWTYLVKDRQAWHELVQKTKTHKVLHSHRKKDKTMLKINDLVGV
jgi:hypothetical protein